MDIFFTILLTLSLLSLGQGLTYPVLEASDSAIQTKRTFQYTGSVLENIVFKCSFDIPDGTTAYFNGDFSFSWFKNQDIDSSMPTMSEVLLNHGNTLAIGLNEELVDHLEYKMGFAGNTAWTQITVKTARPEDSGSYMCRISVTNGSPSELTYTLDVLDLSEFEVILYSSDSPMTVDRMPNTTLWMTQREMNLREKMQRTTGPQEYAYMACVAQGVGKSAVITVSIVNDDDPSRNRDLHNQMQSLVMKDGVGKVHGGKRINVRHLLEDRQFRVNGLDDGSTVRCVAKIEDENNTVIIEAEDTATLNLMSKPQFLNCSKQLHAPVGAQNYMIMCRVRSKPAASKITWKVQPNLGDEFSIPETNNYGYVIDVDGGDDNTYMAKLTIKEVSATEHIKSLFKLHVENEIGSNEFSTLLIEGKDDRTGQTTGSSKQVTSALLLLLVSALAAILVQ